MILTFQHHNFLTKYLQDIECTLELDKTVVLGVLVKVPERQYIYLTEIETQYVSQT